MTTETTEQLLLKVESLERRLNWIRAAYDEYQEEQDLGDLYEALDGALYQAN
jgi:hypothetical protein